MDAHSIALNNTQMENEEVVLNNNDKTLLFKKENVIIEMTELQRRFMLCLLSGINKKNDIIRVVWFYNHETISDNNYHQMIFQCRSLLSRHGIPAQVIKTIPRFGVMLSFQTRTQKTTASIEPENDTSSRTGQGNKFSENVNYRVVLTITLLFSAVVLMGASVWHFIGEYHQFI
ncbi:CadC family transcriptional regulator [Serratia inhibens]|uniref:CadC family transcriptional regulator n=1 Tax=Serratia inhibens TaxID=2338073 RepID=A0AA92X2B9_9GAMM|nr:CadC family transcriptional regulator [Serratia inhibens]RJF54800.1 CadC family transcriptional regulator [Serratia inhibens]